MKPLHEFTDDELNQAFVLEVGKYKMLDHPPQYTDGEGKFCHRYNGKLYISESYPLSPFTTELLQKDGFGTKTFGYMNIHPKFCSDANSVLEYLNKFSWNCSRHVSKSVDYFVINTDLVESSEEKSFCRAAVICLILHYRKNENN